MKAEFTKLEQIQAELDLKKRSQWDFLIYFSESERSISKDRGQAQVNRKISSGLPQRIVFAHVHEPFNINHVVGHKENLVQPDKRDFADPIH